MLILIISTIQATKKERTLEHTYNYTISMNEEGDFVVQEADGPWNWAAGTYGSVDNAEMEIRRHHWDKHESCFDMHDTETSFDESGFQIWTIAVDTYFAA